MNSSNMLNNNSGDIYGSLSGKVHTSQAHTLDGDGGLIAANGAYFEAYGYSKAGYGKTSNTDNFYCGSVYMKGFKYVNFKKSAYIAQDSAVFAVCSGCGTEDDADDACKEAFAILADAEKKLISAKTAAKAKNELNAFILKLNETLFHKGRESGKNYSIDLVVTVCIPGSIVYASVGKVMLLRKRGKRCMPLSGYPHGIIGMASMPDFAPARSKVCTNGDVYILCSRGIENSLGSERIAEELPAQRTDMRNTVVSIIGKAISCGLKESSTCVAIKTNGREIISKAAYIISALCGLITAVDLFFIIKSFFI